MTHSYSPDWQLEIARYEARRIPVTFGAGESLPDAQSDLAALLHQPVVLTPLPAKPSTFAKKRHLLEQELLGQPQIALLHGQLIGILRKSSWPDVAPVLFHRLWREHGTALRAILPTRWLISAAITFADHGETEAQRRLGQSLKVLFSLLKLTEFERLYSGLPPEDPFRLGKKSKSPLPLGLEPFALKDGGLDVNLLAPLVLEARDIPTLGPLAIELLDRLNQDQGTIFRRLALMRAKLLARQSTT